MAILLETILKRQKEVFDLYIANNGREVSLQPLVKKYSEEDLENGQLYPFVKVFEYLKLYISSENISEQELEEYNRVTTMNYEMKFNRGKEIVMYLIENQNRWNEMAVLAKKYAVEDGRFRSYTSDELKEWRRVFLENNKDEELDKTYRTVVELSRNRKNTGYDLNLLKKLLEFNNIEEAAKFVTKISISQKSFNTLVSAYQTIYPNKKTELEYIKSVREEVFNKKENTTKFVPSATIAAKKEQKLIRFKNMLEEYLTSDIEKISDLYSKYEFRDYSFKEFYKDMEATEDKILQLLMNQYEAKITAIAEIRREEVNKILIGIVSGVSYGGAYRKINYYDIKMITDMSLDDILKYAHKFFTRREYELIKTFVENKLISRTYQTKEELFASVNYGRNGKMVSDEEKWMVINFIESNNWPYSTQLFLDTICRYLDKELVIEEEQEEVLEENKAKMNK